MFDGTTRQEREQQREQLRLKAEKALKEFEDKYPEECEEAGNMPCRKLAIMAKYYELTMELLRL